MTVTWKYEATGSRSPEDAAIKAFDALKKTTRDNIVFDIGGKEFPLKKVASFTLLSKREWEVAYLLAEGLTVKEVAQRLDLATKTVEVHKFNIFTKTGIHNQVRLAVMITRLQLSGRQTHEAA